jgi:CBS domain containing-hemolysin-like protein
MTMLIIYVLVALGFSFLCSVAEAVLLSVTTPYVVLLEKEGRAAGRLLREFKAEIGKPLAAILTLNTIAHTVGAAGAGAQAAVVFGNAWLGVASAVLTLLILIFSEIIPKTLGAHHWRRLAPATAHGLRVLIWLLYPFVLLSEVLTRGMTDGPKLTGFSRSEFDVMADLSAEEGQLAAQESEILKNLLRLRKTSVQHAMTPRTVIFSLPESITVRNYFEQHGDKPFSRIPVYDEDHDNVTGFVLRGDLLLAQSKGESDETLSRYRRELQALPETNSLSMAFNEVLRTRAHMVLIVDEYGDVQGLLTLEDILETLLGLEIIDESDEIPDMQNLARNLWQKRAREMGLDIDE